MKKELKFSLFFGGVVVPVYCVIMAWVALFEINLIQQLFPKTEVVQPQTKEERIEKVIKDYEITTPRGLYGNYIQDTIRTRGSYDTVYFYPKSVKRDWVGRYEVLIVADSLSGSTIAQAKIQESSFGLVWTDESLYGSDNMIINGSTTQEFGISGVSTKKHIRVRLVAPTSTQQTAIKFVYEAQNQ